jgi:hypothetical protein
MRFSFDDTEVFNMNKTISLALIGVLLVSIAGASAFALGWGRGFGNADVKAAIEDSDYDAFVASIDRAQTPTEAQFNQLVENYRQEQPIIDARTKVQAAITADDFNAWRTAMTELIDAEKAKLEAQKTELTQENFDAIVQGDGFGHMGYGRGRGMMGKGMMNGRGGMMDWD